MEGDFCKNAGYNHVSSLDIDSVKAFLPLFSQQLFFSASYVEPFYMHGTTRGFYTPPPGILTSLYGMKYKLGLVIDLGESR